MYSSSWSKALAVLAAIICFSRLLMGAAQTLGMLPACVQIQAQKENVLYPLTYFSWHFRRRMRIWPRTYFEVCILARTVNLGINQGTEMWLKYCGVIILARGGKKTTTFLQEMETAEEVEGGSGNAALDISTSSSADLSTSDWRRSLGEWRSPQVRLRRLLFRPLHVRSYYLRR